MVHGHGNDCSVCDMEMTVACVQEGNHKLYVLNTLVWYQALVRA